PLSEGLAAELRRAAGAYGGLVDVQVERVTTLLMDRLERRLDVEEKAGEVLDQAHRPLHEEDLLRQRRVAVPDLEVAAGGVAGRVSALGHLLACEGRLIVAVVKADPPRLVVVLADDAGGVEVGRVALGKDAVGALVADPPFVLPHRRRALGVAVL